MLEPINLWHILTNLNYGAVAVATIASFLWGYFWYYNFFGKPWMKALGLKPEDIATSGISISKAMTASFLASFGHAIGIGILFAALQPSLTFGLIMAFTIWLLFSISAMFKSHVWEDRPLTLIFIDGGYEFVSIMSAAFIFLLWP